MFFNKDKVINSLVTLLSQKNAQIKKLTKKRFNNYGNGKYLILNFDELDPNESDLKDKCGKGGINFWYRTYNKGPFSPQNDFLYYSLANPNMIRNGSQRPPLFASDCTITCVKDCEFTYSQLRKFYSHCLHRTYYPKIRYYQAKIGTVPALPVLKKFNLKE